VSGRRGRTAAARSRGTGAKAGGDSRQSGALTRRANRIPDTVVSLPAPRLARPGAAAPARVLDALTPRSFGLLEVVGAGELQRALADFQREQDWQANRAWRRPGGLARMGWL
jgi:hypothetical protein